MKPKIRCMKSVVDEDHTVILSILVFILLRIEQNKNQLVDKYYLKLKTYNMKEL